MGILLEQVPDRAAADRAANVLFAATIGEAMSRFDQFDVEHLMDVVHPASSLSQQSVHGQELTVAVAAASAESWFERIDEWSQRRLLDPSQVAELRFIAAKAAMERQLRGDDA
ncbi:hypothetical protein [Streptomyces adonidis]|uniref:Uncharacterized protein n=1 Tax=Streptomyces sp. NBC_00093 TaxID=2975649 RepID=A0AAU2AC23_9ACTN